MHKSPSLMYQGTLALFTGVLAYQFTGPGIVPYMTGGIGVGAIAYSLRKPRENFKLLLKNIGLYVKDDDGNIIYPKVLKKFKTKTGWGMVLTLPYGLTTIDIEKVKYRMEQYYDADIEVEYKNKKAFINVHTVKLPEIADFEEVETKPNEWIVGVKHDGSYELLTFDDTHTHMFCAGMTGWGKTNFVSINIYNHNLQNTINDVEYWLIDLKEGSGFRPFENTRLTKVYCDDVFKAGQVLHELMLVTNQRIRERSRKRSIKHKPIFCVIDEYPDLMDFNPEGYKILEYLARKARQANVHIILTTQRASREYLPGTLKCNLAATMCFGCKTDADSEVILGKGDYSGKLITNKGRAILDTPTKRTIVQVPYLPEKDIEKLMKSYQKVVENDNQERSTTFGTLPESESNDIFSGGLVALPGGKPKKHHRKAKA